MKKVDIAAVYRDVKKEFSLHRMPVVDLIEAQTRDPYKVLVSTIISARTKDGTTEAAARRLFALAPTLGRLGTLSEKQIDQAIYPAGFHHNKAKFLHALPEKVASLYNGRIPDTVEELVELPGVGRKTANLVVAVAFNKPAICVDVHVHRISNRLGYVRTRTPLETEMVLRKKLPEKYWTTINAYLVSFGQHTCNPINPHCDRCPIFRYCNRVGVKSKHL